MNEWNSSHFYSVIGIFVKGIDVWLFVLSSANFIDVLNWRLSLRSRDWDLCKAGLWQLLPPPLSASSQAAQAGWCRGERSLYTNPWSLDRITASLSPHPLCLPSTSSNTWLPRSSLCLSLSHAQGCLHHTSSFPSLFQCLCILKDLSRSLLVLVYASWVKTQTERPPPAYLTRNGWTSDEPEGEKPLHTAHSESKAVTHQCGQRWQLRKVPPSLLWRPQKLPFTSSSFSNEIFSFSGISLKQQRKQSPPQPASYSVWRQWRVLLPLSSSVASKKFLGCLCLPLLNCWYTESRWSFCLWKTLCS